MYVCYSFLYTHHCYWTVHSCIFATHNNKRKLLLTHKCALFSFQDPAVAISLVVIAGVLVSTVFLPKMHTISQQSRYRKLKLMNGSDSTVYTTFRDHPLPPMYYPYGAPTAGEPRQQSRSQSRYSAAGGSRLLQSTVLLPPLSAQTGQPMPPAGYGFRFNGLNFLAGGVPPPYANAKSYAVADWSPEHSPGGGVGGYYHANHLMVNPKAWRKISQISDASSLSKKSKNSEQKLLASSLQRPGKRSASGVAAKLNKKSSLLQQQQQRHHGSGLLLQPGGLDYDENARVYHITP